ncbi:DUF5615 family PIN-like protein [Acidobacteria bacterium AH-259-G07]|nr:DUF5615 family PIN-like protein [Acidobacteria bacterium AH-259-G07]
MHWLADQGHEARHVEDEGLRDAEDGPVWSHALESGAVILTKDEDFAERAGRDPHSPVIVWLRVGNATNRALLAWLQPRWSEVIELLHSGNRLIEVR